MYTREQITKGRLLRKRRRKRRGSDDWRSIRRAKSLLGNTCQKNRGRQESQWRRTNACLSSYVERINMMLLYELKRLAKSGTVEISSIVLKENRRGVEYSFKKCSQALHSSQEIG